VKENLVIIYKMPPWCSRRNVFLQTFQQNENFFSAKAQRWKWPCLRCVSVVWRSFEVQEQAHRVNSVRHYRGKLVQTRWGSRGAIAPLKPTKVTLFTMILCNSEDSIRDLRPFCRLLFCHSNDMKYTALHLFYLNKHFICSIWFYLNKSWWWLHRRRNSLYTL